MLGTEPTPLDVRLVAFRIPIRIHPSFWLVAALMGRSTDDPQLLFLWIVCLFISILIHEMGHALTAEAFGWPAEILLYWGGGVAISQRHGSYQPWRNMAVSLAGPFAGFGFYLILRLGVERLIPVKLLVDYPYIVYCLFQLEWINLYWGLVNLLPVLPLDGGNVMRAALSILKIRNPDRMTAQIGIPVAAGVAAYFLATNPSNTFPIVLFVVLCLQNIAMASQR